MHTREHQTLELELGQVIDGRYRLNSVLGRGAWSVVYRAEQSSVGRDVAVKVLVPEASQSSDAVCRALREAHLVAGLNHPNIVTVHDFGRFHGRPFIVMECVNGPSLARVLRHTHRLDPKEAVSLFAQLARALAAAHEQGIVHRDIKPANIMLSERTDGSLLAKLTDFGVASTVTSDLTQAGTILGTPAYMAPEQARGLPLDGRADLYGLGAVMFRALTGERPYEAEDALAMAVCHVTEDLPRFADVAPGLSIDPRLETIVRRCLAKEPRDRYASAKALADDLDVLDSEQRRPPPPPAPSPSAEVPLDRAKPLIASVIASVVTGLVVLFGFGLYPVAKTAPEPEVEMVPPTPIAPREEVPAPEVEPAPPSDDPSLPLLHPAGDAHRVWLVADDGRRTLLPGRVAPGTYKVIATFSWTEPLAAGTVEVALDSPTTVHCSSFAVHCSLTEAAPAE